MIHIQGQIDTSRISTGHKPHKSGAGIHADKRTKRTNTRSSQIRKAINDNS